MARAERDIERETGNELADLRWFRGEVLTIIKRAAEGIWMRQLRALTKGKRPITIEATRTPSAIREVQDANAAVIEAEIALERRIGPSDGGNVVAMRKHPRLAHKYLSAHSRFGAAIRGVKGWQELAVCDLVGWADQATLTNIERRVIERRLLGFLPELFEVIAEREQRQNLGRRRAEQRRQEAERHRAEYRTMVDACPDDSPPKDEAAPKIAADCRRAGRPCSPATVRDHLKSA